ncbi:TetR/AcrR family transcriptional regulator [Pseudaminobacter sp. NGMCC 1.201702]|uniref:TetR/AcrR family transcriptional regulator n=1 Tax=Pseudaminobacter sp. NGMCC 1.201702 TaxID=3391825 RepID=UPI0039EE7DEC
MGRRRSIDRDRVLDAAEEIVGRQGASALTIDAVAKAVGITKGGVQSCFGTKDALIDAMFERWGKTYDELFRELAGHGATPATAVRAHIEATHRSDDTSHAKAASLMAALLQTPEHLTSTRAWYRSRIAKLDMSTDEGRRLRLAFLATEGAFMLRFFGLMDIGAEEWQSIFRDIGTFGQES